MSEEQMTAREAFYIAGATLLMWVFFFYRALIRRQGLLDHLREKHPSVHKTIAADFRDRRVIDKIVGDYDMISSLVRQDRALLGKSVVIDQEAGRLQRSYKANLYGMVICTLSFFLIAAWTVWMAPRE